MAQPLLYAGYVYDRELHGPGEAAGWYWLSVRHYDPALGRFIQPDPSEQEGTRSYAYAGDDPLDATDPSGLDWCVAAIIGTGCQSGLSGGTTAAGVGLAALGVVVVVVSPLALLIGPEAAPITVGGEELGSSLIGVGTRLATVGLAGQAAEGAVQAIQAHQTSDSGEVGSSTSGGNSKPVDVKSAYPDRTKVYTNQKIPRLPYEPDPAAVDESGNPVPHTRLRIDPYNDRVYQGRTFDSSGTPVYDIDFTHPADPNGNVIRNHTPAPSWTRLGLANPAAPRGGFKRVGPDQPLDTLPDTLL